MASRGVVILAVGLVYIINRDRGSDDPADPLAAPGPASEVSAHFAEIDGTLVESAARLQEPLTRTVAEWRSYRWTTLSSYEVERLRLTDDEGVLNLARDGVDWRRGEEKISYAPVNALLSELGNLRAESLEDGASPGGAAALTLDLTDKEGILTNLVMYAVDDDGLADATTSGRDAVLKLDTTARESVAAAIRTIREADVLVEPPNEGTVGGGEGPALDLSALVGDDGMSEGETGDDSIDADAVGDDLSGANCSSLRDLGARVWQSDALCGPSCWERCSQPGRALQRQRIPRFLRSIFSSPHWTVSYSVRPPSKARFSSWIFGLVGVNPAEFSTRF